MPAMKEWTTQFFNTVISKINDKGESMLTDEDASLSSPTTLLNSKTPQAGTEEEEVKTLMDDDEAADEPKGLDAYMS